MHKAARFFALTFLVSWVLWGAAYTLSSGPAVMPLVLLGAFGPSAAAVALVGRSEGRAGLGQLWRRSIQPGRISGGVWLVILLLFPAMAWVGSLLDSALGGTPPALDLTALSTLGGAVGFLLLILFAGPVSEELGWRGYALEPLQEGIGPLRASLLIGVIWSVWHLPLFVIPGTSQEALGVGTLQFWLWIIQVICLAVIFTWAYNRTRRSVLSAIMLHFLSNLTYSLLVPIGGIAPDQTEIISTLLHLVVAAAAIGTGLSRATRR